MDEPFVRVVAAYKGSLPASAAAVAAPWQNRDDPRGGPMQP